MNEENEELKADEMQVKYLRSVLPKRSIACFGWVGISLLTLGL